MLQQILHHSYPSVTLRYMGITEEETNNILKTFSVFIIKNKNDAFKTFVQCKFLKLVRSLRMLKMAVSGKNATVRERVFL